MLGVKINYDEAVRFLTKEVGVEWVYLPFVDECTFTHYVDLAKKRNGSIELFGYTYTVEELERLHTEKEGTICEFSFGPGSNEGYMLHLTMTSGQVMRVKTFDRNTFEHFLNWINRQEGPNARQSGRKFWEPIPVGSIVYMVDDQSSVPKVIPYRLERDENSAGQDFPLRLVDVNPGSANMVPLSDGWENWDNIYFRIEDAIAAIQGKANAK